MQNINFQYRLPPQFQRNSIFLKTSINDMNLVRTNDSTQQMKRVYSNENTSRTQENILSKNSHIILGESRVKERDHSVGSKSKNRNKHRIFSRQQRQQKSENRQEPNTMNSRHKRNRIFDNISHKLNNEQKISINKLSNSKIKQNSPLLPFTHVDQKNSNIPKINWVNSAIKFIDTIPVAPNPRIVRLSSTNPISVSQQKGRSPVNKITFSYLSNNQQFDQNRNFYNQAKPLVRCSTSPFTISIPSRTFNMDSVNNSQSNFNPAAQKIKKPLPTDYKSKGKNIRESCTQLCSLATQKLILGQSFEEKTDHNHNRYFDDQNESQEKKISLTNIDIHNLQQDNSDHLPQIDLHNIFSDFERKKQSVQKQEKDRLQLPKPVRYSQKSQNILQKQAHIIQSNKRSQQTTKVAFPLILIILASLLLLIQLVS